MAVVNRHDTELAYSNGMAVPAHDKIVMGYDGDGNNNSVTYYRDGAVVAVLSMKYNADGNLTEVERVL